VLAYFCQKLQLLLARRKRKMKRKRGRARDRATRRKFSLEIQAIAFEKFPFLAVCVCQLLGKFSLSSTRQTKSRKLETES